MAVLLIGYARCSTDQQDLTAQRGGLIGAVALSDGGQTRPLSALHQTASASSAKAADS
jgi:hypothetical protein